MNNNLIKEKLAVDIHGLIYLLLIGILLFESCGSDNSKGESIGNGDTTNQYLLLRQSGLNKITVTGNEKEYCFILTVKKLGGGKIDSELGAKLEAWNEEQLVIYNDRQKTSYKLLPASLYSYTPENIVFDQSTNQVDVEIKFDPSKVFSELKKTNAQYVIALKLKSDILKVKESESDILLSLFIDYPKVSLASSNVYQVSVNKDDTNVKIMTCLSSQLNDESIGSWCDFDCKLSLPNNAEELVAAYNQLNKTDYELLPQNSYQLGDDIHYRVGDSQMEGMISIRREKLAVKYYLLPLQLIGTGNNNVMYDDAVHYMVISRSYQNPIIDQSAAAPTVILANDGYFYLYATGGNVPVYRSKDLVEWKYIGSAFTAQTRPNWEPMKGRAIWAPEIRYIKDKYVLYYSWAIWGKQDECHIGVATADSPEGPFIDHGCLINGKEIGVRNSIDQFYIEENGKKYMFWGSFNGIYATELTDDGLAVKRKTDGTPVLLKKVCGAKFEATNIYKRGDYFYLFASVGSCCDGLNSTYRAVVGRSKDLLGPYVDDKGGDMLQNNFKLVVNKNNVWVGPGHNSILIKDDEGTEWVVYHSYKVDAIDDGRVVLLDRLRWDENGWPYIKGLEPSNSDLVPVFK